MRVLALFLALMLSAACLGAPPPSVAVQQPVPRLSGHVNDYAEILTSQQRSELEARLASYEAETGHQIGVLTVTSLQGEPIESFSLRVANAWKLGRKGHDDGVLLTVAPKDRQTRIEVGTGMALFVSDAVVAKIINESMIPWFRSDQFGKGIDRGVQRLMMECRAYK